MIRSEYKFADPSSLQQMAQERIGICSWKSKFKFPPIRWCLLFSSESVYIEMTSVLWKKAFVFRH